MYKDILKIYSECKIELSYNNSNGFVVQVAKLKYCDEKECYFVFDFVPSFIKPGMKAPVGIKVYTNTGIYKANTTIISSNVSLREVTMVVEQPKLWELLQLRIGNRKEVEFPVSIQYNDGYEISAKTKDISFGGIAFYSNIKLPEIYKKFIGSLTLEIPDGIENDFYENKFTTEVKFLREYPVDDNKPGSVFVYKFINLSGKDTLLIKNFVLS